VRSANANPDQYLESWIEQTMTANGIYGLKIFSEQFELITKSRWAERLPNLTFIHLRRQDVLGQAISLVRARQSHAWESKHEVRRQPVYSRRSIATALERIALGQARWACWFARNDIEPLRLTYEDIAADPRRAVEFVAERLGIEASPPTEPPMAIQRDRLSEEWRERFVAESRDLSYFHNPWERLLPRIAKLRAHMR
jgi:LPS sulfotransferase NodH